MAGGGLSGSTGGEAGDPSRPAGGDASLPEALPVEERDVHLHRSRAARAGYLVAGSLCVVLAAAGAVLPVLPTTPFLLLAAACYARSSRRFYRRLLASATFGPLIRTWRATRTLPRRTKIRAVAMLWLVLGASAIFFLRAPLARAALVLVGLGVTVFLARIPSSEGDERATPRS